MLSVIEWADMNLAMAATNARYAVMSEGKWYALSTGDMIEIGKALRLAAEDEIKRRRLESWEAPELSWPAK